MADLTCYKCGGIVQFVPTEGGRGSGELTLYRATCDGCGMVEDNLSTDGTLRGAKAHYHRVAVAKAMTRTEPKLCPHGYPQTVRCSRCGE